MVPSFPLPRFQSPLSGFCDILADTLAYTDRQTDRQTDMLITILRFPARVIDHIKNSKKHIEYPKTKNFTRWRHRGAWLHQVQYEELQTCQAATLDVSIYQAETGNITRELEKHRSRRSE